MKKKNKLGFTLIEMLVVVLIIGILAGIALPQYRKTVVQSHLTQCKVMAVAVADAEERYFLINDAYSPSFDNLDVDITGHTDSDIFDTSEKRYFPWGHLWIAAGDEWGSRIGCSINNGINLYIYLRYSNHTPGSRVCRAKNTDLSSPQNFVCKTETGRESGSINTSQNYVDWYY